MTEKMNRSWRPMLGQALGAVVIVYLIFLAAGVHGVFSSYIGVRNFVIGVLALFLAEISTGRRLTSASWMTGAPLFFVGMAAFSGILSFSSQGFGISMGDLKGYYLAWLSFWVILFFLSYYGSQCRKFRIPLGILSLIIITYLSFSLIVYLAYFGIFHTGFTSADMISVLSTNPHESRDFIASHVGVLPFIGLAAVFILYLAGIICFIRWTYRKNKGEALSAVGWKRKVLQVLLLLGAVVMALHWAAKTFPYRDFYIARSYLHNEQKAEEDHAKNVAALAVDDSQKEKGTIILVIGESASRDHMKAFNPSYPAETTPWLSSEKENPDFFFFPRAYSNFPKTSEALAYFLTGVNQYNHDTEDKTVTITDVANKAGYNTYWISNHVPSTVNMATIVSADNSRVQNWCKPPVQDDMNVMPFLKQVPADQNNFVIIHIQGSHDKYENRFPASFTKLETPGLSDKVNDYDTSIAYSDHVLQEIYNYASRHMNLFAMLYCSDHGEDMEYFHGASQFKWDMVHVPLFIYLSPAYQAGNESIASNLRAHENRIFTNDLMFDLLCGLMKTPNNHYETKFDLTKPDYFLTDEQAETLHGKRHITEDPDIKQSQ